MAILQKWPSSIDKYGVMYAFGVNLVAIGETKSGDIVQTHISCGSKEYTDTRTMNGTGTTTINISPYLKAFFTGISGIEEFDTSLLMSIDVQVNGSSIGAKSVQVIYGALMPNDNPMPTSQKIHVWSNYPSTYYFTALEGDVLYPMKDGSIEDEGVVSVTSSGVWTTSLSDYDTMVLIHVNNDAPSVTKLVTHTDKVSESKIYLRWVDRFGCFRYWLFDKGNEEQTDTLVGDAVPVLMNETGIPYYGQRYQGKEMGKSVTAVAPLIDREAFLQLMQLLGSPNVCLYDTDFPDEWIPVTISAGKGTWERDKQKKMQDFEITIVYPTITTSLL